MLEGRLDDGPVPGQRAFPLLSLAEVARLVGIEDCRLTARLDVSTNAYATRLEEIDVPIDPVCTASLGGEDPPPASLTSEVLPPKPAPGSAKSPVDSGALPPCYLAGYAETQLLSPTACRPPTSGIPSTYASSSDSRSRGLEHAFHSTHSRRIGSGFHHRIW